MDTKKIRFEDVENPEVEKQLHNICFSILSRILLNSNKGIRHTIGNSLVESTGTIGLQMDEDGKSLVLIPMNSARRVEVPTEKIQIENARIKSSPDNEEPYYGWIKVSSSLPKEREPVLVAQEVDGKYLPLVAYRKDDENKPIFYSVLNINGASTMFPLKNILFWMPLPVSPQNDVTLDLSSEKSSAPVNLSVRDGFRQYSTKKHSNKKKNKRRR